MKLAVEIDIGPGHIVLDGDPAPPQRGTVPQRPPIFAHVCCGQTAGWTKVSLGKEVDLGRCHIVLDGDPVLPLPCPERGTRASLFSAHAYCGQTVAHLSYC